uniref:Olfactory-binding protein 7 n=1 Tax=Peridroma saucia TaxID=244290 RepID=A0A7S5LKA2_9NEOP|nr:olfactory-binding protein 7 [Peridroma saucia]
MKTFLVLCVVLVTGIHGEFVSPFPKQYDQIVDACRAETGYTDEVIAEEENSNLDLDTGLKKFNNCFLDKTGFRNEKKFELDDALKKIPQRIVTEITKFCQSKIEQGVFTDDTPYISACLHQGASNYIRKTEVQLLAHSETDQVASIVHDCKEDTGFHTSLFYNLGGKFDDEEGLKKFNDCFLEKNRFCHQ